MNLNKRIVTYCPRIDSMVNQEISFRIVDGEKELSLTCTGIRESCHDCFIVQIGEERKEPAAKPGPDLLTL